MLEWSSFFGRCQHRTVEPDRPSDRATDRGATYLADDRLQRLLELAGAAQVGLENLRCFELKNLFAYQKSGPGPRSIFCEPKIFGSVSHLVLVSARYTS